MQKCTTCQFYDRRKTSMTSGSATPAQQGHCRRMAPLLHPVTPKSYVIEGVWPTVRDDDWCGEWKLLARRGDARIGERTAGLMLGGSPSATHVARIGGNIATESIRVGPPGAAAAATIKPFTPPAPSPAQAAVLMTSLAAGTASGDD